ncbi:questin oxidase family protein [Microtetraspora malaysiensis]|uniref:questin oxidase family protein n=1 Tax=Microtetraspora malaysiensis TaxID=161358 RepID=UPI0008356772|nr:questin oxidase family protein [Microtetraspora malaysiensis]
MDHLDEALVRLAPAGPEYRGGLSNHGPMVVEALVRLGAAETIPGWVSGYLPELEDGPSRGDRIADWRAALGDRRRIGDWTAYFTERLAEAPWREVLTEWWPRLTPGLAAGATHGVIRTSHAVRALAERETPPRLVELAQALAYWASGYVELPGRPLTGGARTLDQAVAVLPILELAPTERIVAHLAHLRDLPGFPATVSSLRPPTDVAADLTELTRVFAGVFLTHGRHAPIDFIHAVTAPVAVSSVLEHLPAEQWRPTYDALWQVAAALYSGYAYRATVEPLPADAPQAPEELAGRAAETGDAHAIKLTEAALRQHALTGDPVFLHAAARSVELLGR